MNLLSELKPADKVRIIDIIAKVEQEKTVGRHQLLHGTPTDNPGSLKQKEINETAPRQQRLPIKV